MDEEKLKEIIIRDMQDKYDVQILPETQLVDDLGYDSIHLLELIIDIENEFSIEIPDEDMVFENISQYSNLKNLIESIL